MSDPRLIIALDYAQPQLALNLAAELDPNLCRLKVGKELFTRGGPHLVETLQQRGFDIFLDLKFHDIPNTVAKALAAAQDLGVWMVNVHALGGPRMLAAAREAITGPTKLIAVTILTSMGPDELQAIGLPLDAEENVLRLAGLAHEAGLDGVVCSAQEAPRLKETFGKGFQLVTPGIRPAWAAKGDQTRIMTPADALSAGADYLVVGRPITQASDPLAALQRIHAEIA
ncbi:orotidine-5'-phosphate decarboxylase [Sulfurivirga caldicuralii]|uniref:Orotidine 5'-phosphate decarboxylase n=1 Tax=Sulfurivirga caldicuralii TaxID=364032 RepID=A0A1N6FBS3_9GAMM|nr:orotidine-5'-phosphate decarboxylase [Sulfurivirga caldicuralii]SIN92741.1 orotidine-5'-phosphate decarboxylase [Sulfurivirga caldicuralii]